MKNVNFSFIIVVTWVTMSAVNAQKVVSKQTNVVLTDDQGYGELSIHGHTNLAIVSVYGEVTKSKTNIKPAKEFGQNLF
jgi:hypothetical protein